MNTGTDSSKAALNAYLQADFAKAERLYKQGLVANETTAGADRLALGELLHGLGKLYATMADYAKAEDCFKRARRTLEDTLGVEHPRVAVTVREMADLSWQLGHVDQYKQLNRRSVEMWRDFLVPTAERLPEEMPSFEDLFAARNAREGIDNLFKVARDHKEQLPLCGVPFAIAAMLELGILYRNTGNYATGLQFITFAVDEITSSANTQPLVRAEALKQLAETNRLIGDGKRADDYYRQSLALYREAGIDEHPCVADIFTGMGSNAESRGELDDAERLFSAKLGLTERTLGAQHPQVAYALKRVANIHTKKGQVTTAEVEYKRALDLLQTLGHTHRDVAETWDELGRLYQLQRKYDEAETLYFRAIDIAGSSHGPQPPEVAIYYDRLAEVYRHRGRFQKAETAHQRALGIRRDGLISTHEDITSTLMRLAKLYLDWGKFGDAEAYFRSALELVRKLHGEQAEQTGSCLVWIGVACLQMAKYKEADAASLQAIEVFEHVYQDVAANVALVEPLLTLGQVASAVGRYKQAHSRYEHAQEIIAQAFGEESLQMLALWKLQAELAVKQKKLELATETYRALIRVSEAHGQTDSIVMISGTNGLATIESERGNYETATSLFETALRAASSAPDGQASETIAVLLSLSKHYLRMGREQDSMTYLKQALQTAERCYGQNHPLIAKSHCELAAYYVATDQANKAVEQYLRALQMMESMLGPLHPDLATTLIALGKIWMNLGKFDDAESMIKRGVDIRERCLGSQDAATMSALGMLSAIYIKTGSSKDAGHICDRIRLIWDEGLSLMKPTPVEPLCSLLVYYSDNNRGAEAIQLATKELDIRRMIAAPEYEIVPLLTTLAELHMGKKEESSALEFGRQALKIIAAYNLKEPEFIGRASLIVGQIACNSDLPTAVDLLDQARTTLQVGVGKADERVVAAHDAGLRAHAQLARQLMTAGDATNAEREALVALHMMTTETLAANCPVEPHLEVLIILASIYEQRQEWQKVTRRCEELLSLTSRIPNLNRNTVADFKIKLAHAFIQRGQMEPAGPPLLSAIEDKEQLFGTKSKELLVALEMLASVYKAINYLDKESETRTRMQEINKA